MKAFRSALDGDLYLSTRVRMPVLLRLDEAMADNAVTYHGKETVEHVLPQKTLIEMAAGIQRG